MIVWILKKKQQQSDVNFYCIFRIIQKHIKELSKVISPTHDKLCIPRMYHLECPWPAAQREIYMINAYKVC